MKLNFTKMHGAGNDFIVIDAINQSVNLTTEQWQQLADRRFGVGAITCPNLRRRGEAPS